ncbi:MAG: hypothetical protein ACREYE_33095 [Gammaproteobacteria bacterium]
MSGKYQMRILPEHGPGAIHGNARLPTSAWRRFCRKATAKRELFDFLDSVLGEEVVSKTAKNITMPTSGGPG